MLTKWTTTYEGWRHKQLLELLSNDRKYKKIIDEGFTLCEYCRSTIIWYYCFKFFSYWLELPFRPQSIFLSSSLHNVFYFIYPAVVLWFSKLSSFWRGHFKNRFRHLLSSTNWRTRCCLYIFSITFLYQYIRGQYYDSPKTIAYTQQIISVGNNFFVYFANV